MDSKALTSGGASVPARAGLTWLEGATLALLVALAGIDLVGYRFGDSNQGITVPILKRFMDPSLYRWDVMVATGERFPTLFYATLAALLPGKESIPAAFFALYVFSIAAALAGVYRIGRWCGGPEAGLIAFLIAMPVRNGIANESLYRVQFSHSHLASALVIWAMALFLEGRRILPLLMLSIGAYLHVLYSIYVLVPCVLVLLYEAREVGRRRTLQRLAAAIVPLLPFLAWTLAHRTPMTAEWLALLRLRSSHHSFPSFFGDTLAAGAFLMALGTLTLSRLPREKRAVVSFFFVGFALLFVFGTVFTELVPVEVRPPVPAASLLAVPDADPVRPGRGGRGRGLARGRARARGRGRDRAHPREPAARAPPARGRVRPGRGRTAHGRHLVAAPRRGHCWWPWPAGTVPTSPSPGTSTRWTS